MNKLRIAVVGNRDYPAERKFDVISFIKSLNKDDVVIVSGGARGPDKWAQITSDKFGFETDIYSINISKEGRVSKEEFRDMAYSRNREIVNNCDFLVAFICKDWGGAWHTIKCAIEKNKLVLIRDSRLADKISKKIEERKEMVDGNK